MKRNHLTDAFDTLSRDSRICCRKFVGKNDALFLDTMEPEKKAVADEYARQRSFAFAYNKLSNEGNGNGLEMLELEQYYDFKLQTSLIEELKHLKNCGGLGAIKFYPSQVCVDDEEMCFTYMGNLVTTEFLASLCHTAVDKVAPIQLRKNAFSIIDNAFGELSNETENAGVLETMAALDGIAESLTPTAE